MNVNIDEQEILKLRAECMAHNITFDRLCDRLKSGCSLYAAINMPWTWDIYEITYSSDGVYYNMVKPISADSVVIVFGGTDRDLQEYLEEHNGNT